VRVQGDLRIDKVPGGDSLVQSFTKSSGSRHVCRNLKWARFVTGRIIRRSRPARAQTRTEKSGDCMSWADMSYRYLGSRHLLVGFGVIASVSTVQDSATETFRWMTRGASCKVWRLSLGQVYARDAECKTG